MYIDWVSGTVKTGQKVGASYSEGWCSNGNIEEAVTKSLIHIPYCQRQETNRQPEKQPKIEIKKRLRFKPNLEHEVL
jgi:hypothetical protein